MPYPNPQDVRRACAALAACLGKNVKYAVVGGAACQLLGSTRETEDVDFVVPQGQVAGARAIVAADKDRFTVEPRTRHTYYKSSPQVEIEIISPPGTFKETFDANTSTFTINVDGYPVEILHPLYILNAKCRSILGRANYDKKSSDAIDIQFLLWWLATNQIFPTAQYVPNATGEFVEWFIANYQGEEYWTRANFDRKTGRSRLPECQFS